MTGDALARRLEQFRRRDSLVRAFGVAIHATLAATACAVVATRFVSPEIAVLICASAAAVVTIVTSIVTTRPLDRIAAIIDRRADLSDRTLTAYEHRHDVDAVALLLTRDALARVSTLAPADVFPMRLPSRLAWTIGAAGLAIVVVSATTSRPRTQVAPPSAASEGADEPGRGERSGNAAPGRANPRRAERGRGAPPPPTTGARRNDPVGRGADTKAGVKVGAQAALGARATGTNAADVPGATTAGAMTAGRGGIGTPPATSHSPGARRDVRLTSATAPGQQALPPGLRAYVRSYFNAIDK